MYDELSSLESISTLKGELMARMAISAGSAYFILRTWDVLEGVKGRWRVWGYRMMM